MLILGIMFRDKPEKSKFAVLLNKWIIMKRILVLLALATLVTGLLGSCKKDDIENPDPQGDKTFEEIVKDLPGVYLTADYYDELGYGRVVNLKEDGTTEQYYFFDNDVKDGVSVDEGYIMKGTWTAFESKRTPSKTGFICNMALEVDSEVEAIVDTNYIGFQNNKTYINSSYFGLNELFKVNQSFDEFKTKENLEAFLPGHLKDTELSKILNSSNDGAEATPPEYLSHWMRDIPDDVHLIDLSIPGSHDALSYRCISGAQTQTESIEKQFAWGSRFFDLRVYKAWLFGYRVYPCHGDFACVNLCWTVVNEIEKLIAAVQPVFSFLPKSETAIIRIRCEGPNNDVDDGDFCCNWLYSNLFLTQEPGMITELIEPEKINTLYKDIFIPYRPDLTLGDVRGKIVVMYDDPAWYNNGVAKPHPGYITSDPDGIDGKGRRRGGHKYTFQDECEFGALLFQDAFYYIDKKVSLFENELKINRKEIPIGSKVSNTPYNECLSFNHCSGYLTTYFPVQFSHYVYPEILNALKKEEYERKTYGIVPMDYIGRDDYILEDYALWSNIEDTFNYGPDSGNNVYWTVNTRDLIEQIVKSNDIFKN